jgi:zinc transport system substrate-binding protein
MKLFFTLILIILPNLALAQIKVVASIKPLTLILQEIGGNQLIIEQLIPDQASHHDYPLKMSDHRKLHRADLIVWVGPELESFLNRPLSNFPANKIISLEKLADLQWPEEKEDENENHHHSHDPHLWLNPQNVIVIVKQLTKELATLDKKNAARYQQHANDFIQSLEQLDKQTLEQLAPFKDRGFAVYHHGYSHFVERYHLKQLGYLNLTPERKTGAKHLNQLLKRLKTDGKCIFGEPSVDNDQLLTIAETHQLRVGFLDLMGIKANSYQQLMQSLADSFSTCLSDGSR